MYLIVRVPIDDEVKDELAFTESRVVEVEVGDVETASTIGSYWNAVQGVLEGDDEPIADFEDVEVEGLEVETDSRIIEQLARRGELDIESPYVIPAK